MANPKTAEEIYDTIQNMQPDDALTLADAVLGMLAAQKLAVKALLEIRTRGEIKTETRDELEGFLRG